MGFQIDGKRVGRVVSPGEQEDIPRVTATRYGRRSIFFLGKGGPIVNDPCVGDFLHCGIAREGFH